MSTFRVFSNKDNTEIQNPIIDLVHKKQEVRTQDLLNPLDFVKSFTTTEVAEREVAETEVAETEAAETEVAETVAETQAGVGEIEFKLVSIVVNYREVQIKGNFIKLLLVIIIVFIDKLN